MGSLQFRREAAIQFGSASQLLEQLVPDPVFKGLARGSQLVTKNDEGLKIQFRFSRTNRGTPDKGMLRIFGLRESIASGILSDMTYNIEIREGKLKETFDDDVARARSLARHADEYKITVRAGYRDTSDIVFVGQMMDVRPTTRVGRTDVVTEIELGDSIEGFRSGYVNKVFGANATMQNVVDLVAASAGWFTSADVAAQINVVAPDAVITFAGKGFHAVGRPAETIDEIAEMFGLQWFVRDGELLFAAQGTLLSLPAVVLQEGVDLLTGITTRKGYGDLRGRALLNPRIQPGVGMRILKADGTPLSKTGYRCNAVTHAGDTHGTPWYSDFEAGEIATAVLTEDLNPSELTNAGLAEILR